MASRKRVNRESDGVEKPLEGNNGGKEGQIKRPLRKLKNLDDNSSNTVHWIVLILILSLAILGLIYYYNYFQPTKSSPGKSPTTSSTQKDTNNNKNKEPLTKTSKSKQKTKNEPTKKKSSGKKPQTKKNSQSTGKVESTSSSTSDGDNLEPAETFLPEYSKEKPQHIKFYPKNLRERLLRLPIPPSDPDRPLALEIVSADDFLVRKNYPKALEKFNELLARLSQSPRSLYGKAIALENIAESKNNMKVMDSAIEYYRKVSMESFLGPDIIKEASLIRLVTLLNRRERYDQAISACMKLFKMDPDNDGYAIQLALTYIKGGKIVEAKKQLQLVLDKWPDSPIAKGNLGYIYSAEGDCGRALPLLMAGLEGDEGIKRNPAFYTYAGDCLVKLNMYNESLDLYQAAVDNGVFPSLWQRPLVYSKGLKAQPWWSVSECGIERELTTIVNERETILSELTPLIVGDKFIVNGDSSSTASQSVWSLWVESDRGDNCHVTPRSCDLINNMTSSSTTAIKEVKVILFSSSLHIPPRVGSTGNDRLRAIIPLHIHIGSILTIRVGDSKRVLYSNGHSDDSVLVLDDSYEQELWYSNEEGTVTESAAATASIAVIILFEHPQLQITEE